MLEKLKPSKGSTKKIKRVGRGQGSGMGKTATRGNKGYGARSGSGVKPGFEGGQQPIYKRLPKVGFKSRIQKPFAINVDKIDGFLELEEITISELVRLNFISARIKRVKLIGKNALSVASKIKDESISYSNRSN